MQLLSLLSVGTKAISVFLRSRVLKNQLQNSGV